MFVGILRLTLDIEGAQSLKDRRSVVRSLRDKLKPRFNVAVAELEDDTVFYNRAKLGIATISNEHKHADEQLQQILGFIDKQGEYVISSVEEEIISFNE
ncbi:MAG: DUF503 domain-containing protein [Deferribacteraceae bacterium]|jgi:uncharacterized protein YlxP (DUF503 family)|nr:DUF503 domain-containing protein [Deferribacteraceae bacterium]